MTKKTMVRLQPRPGAQPAPERFPAGGPGGPAERGGGQLFRWLRLNQWIAVKSVGWVPVTIYDKTQFNRPEWAGMNVLARRRGGAGVSERKAVLRQAGPVQEHRS